MKTLTLALAALLTLTAVAVPAPASAQETPNTVTKVVIPFAFEVGSQHFAPGAYTIMRETEHMLRISGTAGTTGFMALNEESINPASSSKVVFKHYGAQFFLAEIWIDGSNTHLEAVKTKAEQQARKTTLAAAKAQPQPGQPQPETVTLASIR